MTPINPHHGYFFPIDLNIFVVLKNFKFYFSQLLGNDQNFITADNLRFKSPPESNRSQLALTPSEKSTFEDSVDSSVFLDSLPKVKKQVPKPRISLEPKPECDLDTPFLRHGSSYYNANVKATLDKNELILFNPCRPRKQPTITKRNPRAPITGLVIPDAAQSNPSNQIAAISYEIYCDGELVTDITHNSQLSKQHGLTGSPELRPDQAELILNTFSKQTTDKELDNQFNSFLRETPDSRHFKGPTMVFLVWMQDDYDKKESR